MSAERRVAIEERIAKVSGVTGLSVALSITAQLVTVPVCLRYWGNDTYGAWLAVYAAYSVVRTLDGGFITYVGNKINVLFHGEQSVVRGVLASAAWGVAIWGLLEIAILCALYATGTMGLIVEGAAGSSPRAGVALLVLSISWVTTGTYVGILHRLMIPAGLMYQATWWAIASQVAQSVSLAAAAAARLSLVSTAFVVAGIQGAICFGSAMYIRRKLPAYFPWWRAPSIESGVMDLVRSVPLTLAGMLQQAGTSGLVLVVSAALGPSGVPVFVTLRTLSNLWATLANIVTAPLLPEVVRFYANRESEKLRDTFRAHWLVIGVAVNATLLLAYPLVPYVYETWTAGRLPFDRRVLGLLLASVSVGAMSALGATLLAGVNHMRFVVSAAALRGAVAIGVSSWLLPRAGLAGAGIAVLASEVVIAVVVGMYLRRFLFSDPGKTLLSLGAWSWVSTVVVCVFLVTATDVGGGALGKGGYAAAWGVTVFASIRAWKGVGDEVRRRLRDLSGTALGRLYERSRAGKLGGEHK